MCFVFVSIGHLNATASFVLAGLRVAILREMSPKLVILSNGPAVPRSLRNTAVTHTACVTLQVHVL
jgi:hypothetical protein